MLNLGTQDVTAYDLQTFEKVSVVPVPGGAQQIASFDGSEHVFALAERGIVAIDGNDGQSLSTWSDGRYAGAHPEGRRLFFGDRSGLRIIDVRTLDEQLLPEYPNTVSVVIRSAD